MQKMLSIWRITQNSA